MIKYSETKLIIEIESNGAYTDLHTNYMNSIIRTLQIIANKPDESIENSEAIYYLCDLLKHMLPTELQLENGITSEL